MAASSSAPVYLLSCSQQRREVPPTREPSKQALGKQVVDAKTRSASREAQCGAAPRATLMAIAELNKPSVRSFAGRRVAASCHTFITGSSSLGAVPTSERLFGPTRMSSLLVPMNRREEHDTTSVRTEVGLVGACPLQTWARVADVKDYAARISMVRDKGAERSILRIQHSRNQLTL